MTRTDDTALPLRAIWVAVAVVVLGWGPGAGPAAAHTELQGSEPAADAVVADPPLEVVLTFDAALEPGSEPAVRVIDPAGDDLVAAPPTLDGAVVTVPLNLAVAPGPHRVDWAITAEDGDDQTGTFTFTFDPPSEVATPPDATPPPGPTGTAAEGPEPTTAAQPTASMEQTPSAPPSPAAGTIAEVASELASEEASEPASDGGPGGAGMVAVVVGALAAAAAVGLVLIRRAGDSPDAG